jgi:hypothetical protein
VSSQSRLIASILLILLPTVEFGGVSILLLLIGDLAYAQNEVRQDLWRAGHAHAGVWLVLSLVALRYVDEVAGAALLAGRLLPLGPLSRGDGPERVDLPGLRRGCVAGCRALGVGVGLIRGAAVR